MTHEYILKRISSHLHSICVVTSEIKCVFKNYNSQYVEKSIGTKPNPKNAFLFWNMWLNFSSWTLLRVTFQKKM